MLMEGMITEQKFDDSMKYKIIIFAWYDIFIIKS